MQINLNKEIVNILKEWNEERKTQERFSTAEPIYLVQMKKYRIVDPKYDTPTKEVLCIPEISDEGFTPTFEEIKEGALRDTELPCNLVMELEKKDNLDEVLEEFQEYYCDEKDKYYYTEKIYMEEYWETKAYFLSYEEAKQYQDYQAHNLGESRVYADYVGYGNKGTLARFLRLLDETDIFEGE